MQSGPPPHSPIALRRPAGRYRPRFAHGVGTGEAHPLEIELAGPLRLGPIEPRGFAPLARFRAGDTFRGAVREVETTARLFDRHGFLELPVPGQETVRARPAGLRAHAP